MQDKKIKEHIVNKYAKDIVSGKILAGEFEILACRRHLDDLKRQNTKDFPYVFDETRADRIIKWFNLCYHIKGSGNISGTSIELIDAHKMDMGIIFGWVHATTGKRRFKTAYLREARGSAKSTRMSGIALYGMCADAIYPPFKENLAKFENEPEIVIAAVDREQADIVWGDARNMALASPAISDRLDILKGSIKHKQRGGKFRKLSKDLKNKDGGSPSIIIIDEYHKHPTSEIKDTTASGKGKRSQCLEFMITTAGVDCENNPCYKEDLICQSILKREIIVESYYVMIRQIDKDDNIHDKKCWSKANAMFRKKHEYGRILFEEMETEYDLAFGSMESSKVREWMIKRVNVFQADSEEKYFSGLMEKWKSLGIPRKDFLELVKGKECYNGNDFSKCVDLTATAFVFRLDDGKYAVTAHGFMPNNTIKHHEYTDKVPYNDYKRDGWLTGIEADVMDDRDIINYIHKMENEENWKIKEVCTDPAMARQFMNVMGESGEGYTVVEVRQGYVTLSEPTKKFRDLARSGLIVHDNSPLLTWCISNAMVVSGEAELIKLSKKNITDTQRIDLLAAIIFALYRALMNENINNCPYNENRGILMLD